jgi:hypothetical protein
MTQDNSPAAPRWVRKLLIPGLIGAVAGFAASMAMMRFIDSSTVGGLGKSATIAALIAVLYAVVGVSVGLGAASPKAGARFLNVEDADELSEQKKVLTLSGAAMTLWGVSLFALALAAPEGPVPQTAALVAAVAGLAIGGVLSVWAHRASDELMRAINLEAGSLSYGLVVLVGGGWALLAHLSFADAPVPLDWVSLFYVLVLLASFIVVGRRGMLKPR